MPPLPPPAHGESELAALRRELALARHEADHDELTGLLNRRGLRRRLADLEQAQVAVVMLDLDGLKRINDAHGHMAGDAAITCAAQALIACVRPHDLLARWGGDEFVAVLAGGEPAGPSAETLVVRFARAVADALPQEQTVHLSLGLATGGNGDFDRLLAESGAHLRQNKQGTR